MKKLFGFGHSQWITAIFAFFLSVSPCVAESDKAVTPDVLTLAQFKENLPEDALELDLAGFLDLKKQGDLLVLDVRSKEIFATRHLKDSVNIPLTDLTEKTLSKRVPDKNIPVVLVCDNSFSPTRMLTMTLQAYPVLKANGYQKIYRLNLWQPTIISEEVQEKTLDFEGTSVGHR